MYSEFAKINQLRKKGSNNINSESSRSHLFLIIYVYMKEYEGDMPMKVS